MDKIILKVIVDDRSGIGVVPKSTMNKLELKIIQNIILKVRLVNQRPSQSLGQIHDFCMQIEGIDYMVSFHILVL